MKYLVYNKPKAVFVDMKDKIEWIKSRLTIKEVLERYCGEADNQGRWRCIFHNGKDRNMGVIGETAHCFVCGESGDLIEAVKRIFNISTKQSLEKLDYDFNLGYGNITEEKKAEFENMKREKLLAKQRLKNEQLFEKKVIDLIAYRLKKADEYISKVEFKGNTRSELIEYTCGNYFRLHHKAIDERERLEWFFCVLLGDKSYLKDERYCMIYGTDKTEILRKIYKKEIFVGNFS